VKKKFFVDVGGFFLCVQNGGNSSQKNSVTSLKFILNFQKNWIRFIMISKIKLKKAFT
jgi:hypothetical protein